jgi:hypothetical protein
VVHDELAVGWRVVEAVGEGQVRESVRAEMARPYDLAGGPLVRVLLVRLAADEHVCVLGMHLWGSKSHRCWSGWCSWGCWHDARVIVSLLYRATRTLLSIPGVLLRRDTAKDAELLVLRHENAVLRRQITGPVRYEPADRFWLTSLSSLVPRRRSLCDSVA